MHKTIYVGNLPFSSTEDDIRSLFEAHGTVQSVKLIADRDSGKPRGFGFVQMDAEEAEAAIEALNGYELGGRALRINEARQRTGHRVRRPF
ncbi:RNA-binding protein [Aquisalimonas sp.]|uniref:RNA recognition motif domain-containing protein n=1 Tax=unclassified Aquisalimonas TaxID=2644645 RepID=UPI0025BBBF2B|nr:RNA-binding protein [Aquisalimonas sp.]